MRIPTLQPFSCHFFSKALRRKRQHVIFSYTCFQSQTAFTFKTHGYLLPGGMPLSLFLEWPPPGRWQRHLHTLGEGRGGTSTTSGDEWISISSLSLQKQKKKKPLVNTWLTLPFISKFKCNLLTILFLSLTYWLGISFQLYNRRNKINKYPTCYIKNNQTNTDNNR